jgi:hypothetical protein
MVSGRPVHALYPASGHLQPSLLPRLGMAARSASMDDKVTLGSYFIKRSPGVGLKINTFQTIVQQLPQQLLQQRLLFLDQLFFPRLSPWPQRHRTAPSSPLQPPPAPASPSQNTPPVMSMPCGVGRRTNAMRGVATPRRRRM